MQCFPEGWVTDVLSPQARMGRSPEPGYSRNAALRCLGNAVVPPQGAAALRLLLARMGERAAA
jgi:hypothetical protein